MVDTTQNVQPITNELEVGRYLPEVRPRRTTTEDYNKTRQGLGWLFTRVGRYIEHLLRRISDLEAVVKSETDRRLAAQAEHDAAMRASATHMERVLLLNARFSHTHQLPIDPSDAHPCRSVIHAPGVTASVRTSYLLPHNLGQLRLVYSWREGVRLETPRFTSRWFPVNADGTLNDEHEVIILYLVDAAGLQPEEFDKLLPRLPASVQHMLTNRK